MTLLVLLLQGSITLMHIPTQNTCYCIEFYSILLLTLMSNRSGQAVNS